jgi:hypothetical protein
MEPKPQKPMDFQKSVNTVLLTLCLTGIIWIISEVNTLQVANATSQLEITANTNAISELQRRANDGGQITEKIDIRLSRLETIQDQQKNKH